MMALGTHWTDDRRRTDRDLYLIRASVPYVHTKGGWMDTVHILFLTCLLSVCDGSTQPVRQEERTPNAELTCER